MLANRDNVSVFAVMRDFGGASAGNPGRTRILALINCNGSAETAKLDSHLGPEFRDALFRMIDDLEEN